MTNKGSDRSDLRYSDYVGGSKSWNHSNSQEARKTTQITRTASSNARSTSVPNFSRVLRDPVYNLKDRKHRLHLGSLRVMDTQNSLEVKRWDPESRTSSSWDELRRVSLTNVVIFVEKRADSHAGWGTLGPRWRLCCASLWYGKVKERTIFSH